MLFVRLLIFAREFDLRAIFGEAWRVMNPRFFFLGGTALLAFTTGAFAQNGPVTIVNLTNSSPETPTPPPAAAPSTPSTPDTSDADKPAAKPATAPEKKDPSPAPAPAPAAASTTTAAAPAPAATTTPAAKPAAKGAGSILDNYISDLTDAVKLSDDEKKEIQSYYQADGTTLQKILNNDALSPLQQAGQVADLRDQRDAKIDTLLQDPTRQHEFYEVEANYRVALTEFAADGGLVPASPAAPAPAAAK
jgi:hypothetical protein